jgi:RHS repeat-associated protein
VYDGLGRREKKTINGSLTEFLFDGVNPVQETSGATVLANILRGLGVDEFLTRTDVGAGITSNLLSDALGSAVGLADAAGVVQTEYTYEPFGKTTSSGSSNSSSYQYTGRENDGTGLYYYRARYYHPALQRFIREDPWKRRHAKGATYTPMLETILFGIVIREVYLRKDPMVTLILTSQCHLRRLVVEKTSLRRPILTQKGFLNGEGKTSPQWRPALDSVDQTGQHRDHIYPKTPRIHLEQDGSGEENPLREVQRGMGIIQIQEKVFIPTQNQATDLIGTISTHMDRDGGCFQMDE